eukprot:COSAG05_NODE_44_length_25563_cov_118.074419_2_plen_72_part_00
MRVGAGTNVYSHKGRLLKKKSKKRIRVNVTEPKARQYITYRADDTDSDSSDDEYRVHFREDGASDVIDLSE